MDKRGATVEYIAVICIVIILFMRESTQSRPDWYQQELDDEQMLFIRKIKKKGIPSENECNEKD